MWSRHCSVRQRVVGSLFENLYLIIRRNASCVDVHTWSCAVCARDRVSKKWDGAITIKAFETCFLWWLYNSCCTIRTAAVLTSCKTLCRFLTNCCGLYCYHPFTLHRTQSIRNRKWQRRSPGARANWPVDLYKLDQLISSPLFAWLWQNFLCDINGQFGFV